MTVGPSGEFRMNLPFAGLLLSILIPPVTLTLLCHET